MTQVVIDVLYDGGLGNYLFQYCFGRILAGKLGYRLTARPIPGFPRTGEEVPGADFSDREPLVLRGQKPDLSPLGLPGVARRVVCSGYFQRYEYYRPHAGRIREWLAVRDHVPEAVAPGDIVLSIRRGRDYIPHWGLPLSYYEGALSVVPHERVYICTNEPRDPFVRHLARRHGATIRGGPFHGGKMLPDYWSGALDQLLFIKKFRNIVVSNSSFSWWSAWLSDADRIVFPRPASGLWAKSDPVSRDLELEVDEPRYMYLECEAYRSEFLSERALNWRDASVRAAKAVVRPFVPRWMRRTPARPAVRFHDDP